MAYLNQKFSLYIIFYVLITTSRVQLGVSPCALLAACNTFHSMLWLHLHVPYFSLNCQFYEGQESVHLVHQQSSCTLAIIYCFLEYNCHELSLSFSLIEDPFYQEIVIEKIMSLVFNILNGSYSWDMKRRCIVDNWVDGFGF